MLSVRELKVLVRELDPAAFVKQVGPFVLIERPFSSDKETGKNVARVTRPLKAPRRKASVLDFEDLWVATLPPMATHDSLSVGRSPDCDLVINEGTVSKLHARIEWHVDHAELEDLGSSNGTLVNDVKVSGRQRLKDNDSIDFGGVQVYFIEAGSLRKRLMGVF